MKQVNAMGLEPWGSMSKRQPRPGAARLQVPPIVASKSYMNGLIPPAKDLDQLLISRSHPEKFAASPNKPVAAYLPDPVKEDAYQSDEKACAFRYPTSEHKGLLTPSGQVETLGKVLKLCLSTPEQPLPQQVVVALDYEHKPPVDAMRRTLGDMAAMAQGNGWKMRLARSFMNAPNEFPPMQLLEDEANPKRVALTMNIAGVPQEELMKLANFLIKQAHYVGEEYR